MREFFKPWRRKIGVVTLGMATVAAGGWVRSIAISDTFFVLNGWLNFSDGAVTYSWWDESQFLPYESNGQQYRMATGDAMKAWTAPYWPVVIPLTLLSAYLLLSKSRPPTSKTTEPAPTTGV